MVIRTIASFVMRILLHTSIKPVLYTTKGPGSTLANNSPSQSQQNTDWNPPRTHTHTHTHTGCYTGNTPSQVERQTVSTVYFKSWMLTMCYHIPMARFTSATPLINCTHTQWIPHDILKKGPHAVNTLESIYIRKPVGIPPRKV